MADEEKKQEGTDDKKVTFINSKEDGKADGKGSNPQKVFCKEELRRLQTHLKNKASGIHRPSEEPYMPFVWTSLKPYCDTYTAAFLIESNDPVTPRGGYKTRKTAVGLCDPWVDYNMDRDLDGDGKNREEHDSTQADNTETNEKEEKNKDEKDEKKRPPKEGSTRLPKFPILKLETEELAKEELDYGDVPRLRNELKQKYSLNAEGKIQKDYTRTKQDFYRMELDKLEEVHPLNRKNMLKSYFAYLQNTPGSRGAVKDCVKTLSKSNIRDSLGPEENMGDFLNECRNPSYQKSRPVNKTVKS
ncbi:hypothetical protein ScPMuIL_008509 [Solemya velum]